MRTAMCRLVGCTSPFAARWSWPYRLVCAPLHLTRGERSGQGAEVFTSQGFVWKDSLYRCSGCDHTPSWHTGGCGHPRCSCPRTFRRGEQRG